MLPAGYIIESMQVDDVPAIMEIEVQAQEYPWSSTVFIDCLRLGFHGYVVRNQESNKIVCFNFFSFAADECHLLNIATEASFQRQGFAKALLTYSLAVYRQNNIRMCFLEVRESNTIAQQIYQDFGFKVVGIRRGYYPAHDGRENALVMRVDLIESPGLTDEKTTMA